MLKVLIVDDEELVRRGIVMETDWRRIGCMVVAEAENGKEGLAMVEKYQPDVIVTDIRMPVMTGLEMVKAARDGGCKAKVIFLTAYNDFEYARDALKLGAADYLLKPFEDGELETVISQICEIYAEGKSDDAKEVTDSVNAFLELPKGDKSKYVSEALNFVAANLDAQDLCVGMIAEHLGLSEGHLSHLFKKETSYTVNAYITRYRIRRAMELLRDCRVKVYEVAEQVGYKDITYFSTVFKKLVGINPSEFQDRSK